MNRRRFLTLLAAAAPAFALDPERLLWVPGKKTFFLPSAKSEWPDSLTWGDTEGLNVRLAANFVVSPQNFARYDVLYGYGVVPPHMVAHVSSIPIQMGIDFEWSEIGKSFSPQQIKDCAQRMAEDIDRRLMVGYEDIARRKS